jgi:hypothetical protein
MRTAEIEGVGSRPLSGRLLCVEKNAASVSARFERDSSTQRRRFETLGKLRGRHAYAAKARNDALGMHLH